MEYPPVSFTEIYGFISNSYYFIWYIMVYVYLLFFISSQRMLSFKSACFVLYLSMTESKKITDKLFCRSIFWYHFELHSFHKFHYVRLQYVDLSSFTTNSECDPILLTVRITSSIIFESILSQRNELHEAKTFRQIYRSSWWFLCIMSDWATGRCFIWIRYSPQPIRHDKCEVFLVEWPFWINP